MAANNGPNAQGPDVLPNDATKGAGVKRDQGRKVWQTMKNRAHNDGYSSSTLASCSAAVSLSFDGALSGWFWLFWRRRQWRPRSSRAESVEKRCNRRNKQKRWVLLTAFSHRLAKIWESNPIWIFYLSTPDASRKIYAAIHLRLRKEPAAKMRATARLSWRRTR